MIDRRVARTRTALFDALVLLVRRKPYDDIRVADILREAGVGRATFYAHFTSKDDLLERSMDRLRELLMLEENSAAGTSLVRALFDHIAEHRDIPIALSGGKGATIIGYALDRVLTERLRAKLPTSSPSGWPRELFIRHAVSCCDTVLSWWLEREPRLTAGEAYSLFKQLIVGTGSASAEGWSDCL